jgi:hypothetical protein
MHARHETLLDTRESLIDQLAEWLLAHCPFTTLTVLIVLVAGSLINVPQPMTLAVVMPLADLTLNFVRRHRVPQRLHRRATA